MKTKSRSLIAFVLLSAASLTILFGSPSPQPGGNPQTEPDVSLPGMVSNDTDNTGMRTRVDTDLPSRRYGSHIDLNQPGVTLEQLDARSLTLEPNQIGVNRSVEVSPSTRAQKFVNPDGSQVIVLIIKSSDASGVGVHFRNFALADGEEVYVYGAATDSIVFGPFTDKGPWGSGEFWSGTVDGDTAVIEFYKRSDENGQGFEVFEISHILAELDWRLRSNEPDVLFCEVDATCYGDPEKNAVARIIFNDNGGTYLCTGTLLNDFAEDRTPYFLTANHCVDSRQSLKLLKHIGFTRQPVVTVAFCEVGSILHRAPISLRRKAPMIFPSYGYRTMLLPGRIFPVGLPSLNQQALVFSGFTTPMGTSRHLSLHTYEGRPAVLRTRMRIASAW